MILDRCGCTPKLDWKLALTCYHYNYVFVCAWHLQGASRRPIFFHFHAVSRENGQIASWHTALGVEAPGKFWIRHCNGFSQEKGHVTEHDKCNVSHLCRFSQQWKKVLIMIEFSFQNLFLLFGRFGAKLSLLREK